MPQSAETAFEYPAQVVRRFSKTFFRLTVSFVTDVSAYLHGAIESDTPNVHQTFDGALGESLDMQSRIYGEMSSRGWYQTQQADAQQIAQVRGKFSC